MRYALCTTDENGPVKNIRCKVPDKGSNQPMCETMASTPSARTPLCRELKRRYPEIYPTKRGETVMIRNVEDYFNTTFCYAFDRGPHGWCRVGFF
jgi:hypothetical protein